MRASRSRAVANAAAEIYSPIVAFRTVARYSKPVLIDDMKLGRQCKALERKHIQCHGH